MPLSDLVQSHIVRLGAILPTSWDEPTHLDDHEIPEPFRQLACVTWPQGVSFQSDSTHRLWVWMLELGALDGFDMSEVGGSHEGPLAILGDADGGNYWILLRIDDPDPSDPVVYKVDHAESDEPLRGDVPLSSFLASLRPEAK